MIHALKIWPEYFSDVLAGVKTFEIRRDDRHFKVGDYLRLAEYDPHSESHSGRFIDVLVIYLTRYEQKPGFVVMSIRK